ncbi:MAG: hypothetical protein FIB08_12025 [Candidatus Methanoperedens sp.]|nr:hypothetical protein [Candidatus Methanoperedens sp.]
MSTKQLTIWFSTISIILVFWGIVFAFFGLDILPIINRDILLQWESALYGAIMMGWGVTLLMVGRIAFSRNDTELLKALLYGIVLWLIVEGLFSAYLGVWFNVGVDIGVLILFSFPIIKVLRSHKEKNL